MKYTVQLDVIFTGDVEIEAKDLKEAREKALQKSFVSSDLRMFYMIGSQVVDITPTDE